jgi:hypothetical protein
VTDNRSEKKDNKSEKKVLDIRSFMNFLSFLNGGLLLSFLNFWYYAGREISSLEKRTEVPRERRCKETMKWKVYGSGKSL